MTYIVAEIGVNHNGDIRMAKRLINVAVDAGTDAVKFQLFHIDRYRHLQLSEEQIAELARYCDYCDARIEFLCTPFDIEAVDFLDPLVKRFKVGSGQSNDLDFLAHISTKGKPMIISTGMSEFSDIRHALTAVDVPVTLLHCVSLYPTPPEKADLARIKKMMAAFACDIGYSDHTEGINFALAAVALGAKVIEKHITLDKNMTGPDHKASITPDELKALVSGIRQIEKSLCSPTG